MPLIDHSEQRNILFCVLNWGLGHATRSIPIINFLRQKGHTIHIASDGIALQLLKTEYPECHFTELPSYDISYRITPVLGTISSIPRIIQCYRKEQQITADLVRLKKIDVVISDNRYGCYSNSISSFIICHQLNPFFFLPNIFQPRLKKIYARWINNFSKCLIPDHRENSLLGAIALNEFIEIPVVKIGILSRLNPQKHSKGESIVAVCSGPEPQRTHFQDYIIDELEDLSIVLVKGSDQKIHRSIPTNFTVFDLCKSTEIEELISNADLVICRSGYSSIMDLLSINKQAILVPTSGMPEQELLAKNMNTQSLFLCIQEKKYELRNAISNRKSGVSLATIKSNDFISFF